MLEFVWISLWVMLVLITPYVAESFFHAMAALRGYNKNVTKEVTWPNVTPEQNDSSQQSRLHAELSGSNTSPKAETWSLGAEVLARSLSIERSNKTKKPAAESGSNKE